MTNEVSTLSEELLDAIDGATESRGRDTRFTEWAAAARKLEIEVERARGAEKQWEKMYYAALNHQPQAANLVTFDRETVDLLLSEVEAVMNGEHGPDWADDFGPLFGLVEDMRAHLARSGDSTPAVEPSEQPAPEDRNWQNGFRAGAARSLPRLEFNQHCSECQRNKITIEVFGTPGTGENSIEGIPLAQKSTAEQPKLVMTNDIGVECENGLLPDGPSCPRCGGPRAASGVDGGSWVHYPSAPLNSNLKPYP